jgi:hypothetical protein
MSYRGKTCQNMCPMHESVALARGWQGACIFRCSGRSVCGHGPRMGIVGALVEAGAGGMGSEGGGLVAAWGQSLVFKAAASP